MNNKLDRDFSSIEDFVWDEDFRNWVLNKNDDLDEYWGNWIAIHQEKSEDIIAAKQIVKAMHIKETHISDTEVDEAIQNILSQIDQKPQTENIKIKPNYNSWFKYGIAAVLLVTIGIALLFFTKNNDRTSATYEDLAKGSETDTNEGAAPKEVLLADGSKIILQKNARISFASKFNNFSTRKINLTGKATFEVARNPKKPFFVYANGLITKVLGTKFTITSNNGDKNVTVEVISGIVSVFSLVDKKSQDYENTKKLNSLVLTRNQKANFSSEERTLVPAVVAQPIALNEQAFDYSFADEPVKKIFKTIADSYGITIIYDEKAITNRTFTADLSKTTMYEKLNIICKTINARYEIVDGKIIIYNTPS